MPQVVDTVNYYDEFLRFLDYYDEFWGVLDYYDEFWGVLDYYDEFGNSRADFFEPGSRIPLPSSPGADFFQTGSRIPLPRARSALGAPPKAAPGRFLEPVSKKSAPGDLGRGILEPGSEKMSPGIPPETRHNSQETSKTRHNSQEPPKTRHNSQEPPKLRIIIKKS